ncbi:MAG: type II toxin-antitoxin system VapB family antitoxin [Gemmatimonadetes bacterium]|nr:type II toxin-antitoxin system VapB family antitoxin [Gemmatimonadota bacterium]
MLKARTTVVLDPALLEEARRLSGAKTKREAIERALNELVKRLRREAVALHAGTLELALTQDDLNRVRQER